MSRTKLCPNLLSTAKVQFSTSSACSKSHYDELEITSKATQSDIKSAYYKLSKVYHPDKNKSEEAKVKFRKITDAYEILGNYKSRSMYDRGMRPGLRHVETNKTPEEKRKEDAQARFYKSRLRRTQVQPTDGRTPIYDFDAWSKAHYGELFNRTQQSKNMAELIMRHKESERQNSDTAKLLVPIFLLLYLTSMMFFTSNIDAKHDRNKVVPKKKESE